MNRIVASILFTIVCGITLIQGSPYVVGGYFPNWAPDLACHALPVSSFDASPYTHIWYAFGSVSTSTWAPTAGGDENGGVLTQLVNLKKNHPNLKVLFSVGGGGQDQFFQPLTSSAANRKSFISQLIPWLRKYNLDGIDFDWEFPTGTQANNFAELFAEVRTAIDQDHNNTGKPALLQTVAGYGTAVDLKSWPIKTMANSLDWFNAMTYEEHGPWSNTEPTGINSPLYSNDGYDINDCVKAYIAAGVPASKIMVGAPTFAHTWMLKNASSHGIGAPGAGPGPEGKCTKSKGDLAYFEVKSDYIAQGATTVWDTKSLTPYLYKGNVWVSYENPDSFKAKAQYVVENKLRGLFVWDIDEDDKNELIDAAAAVFNGSQ